MCWGCDLSSDNKSEIGNLAKKAGSIICLSSALFDIILEQRFAGSSRALWESMRIILCSMFFKWTEGFRLVTGWLCLGASQKDLGGPLCLQQWSFLMTIIVNCGVDDIWPDVIWLKCIYVHMALCSQLSWIFLRDVCFIPDVCLYVCCMLFSGTRFPAWGIDKVFCIWPLWPFWLHTSYKDQLTFR